MKAMKENREPLEDPTEMTGIRKYFSGELGIFKGEPQMMVGVNQMERRGRGILSEELSGRRGRGRRSCNFGDPGRKPEWLGGVGGGQLGEGPPHPPPSCPPSWTPGLAQARKWQLSPHFRLMKENLEVMLFLLILDFLLKCFRRRLDADR